MIKRSFHTEYLSIYEGDYAMFTICESVCVCVCGPVSRITSITGIRQVSFDLGLCHSAGYGISGGSVAKRERDGCWNVLRTETSRLLPAKNL